MLSKINLLSLLTALFLFFLLRWLDIRCSEHKIATQSGLQTVYGGVSLSEEMRSMTEDSSAEEAKVEEKDESMGFAALVGLALVAVLAGCYSAFAELTGRKRSSPTRSTLFAALALVLLLTQLMIGFPAEAKLREAMANESGGSAEETDELGRAMGDAMRMSFRVEAKPVFYLELLALGIPTLILVNGLLDRVKKDA